MRLNSRGWTAKAIASYLKCASSTVRQAIHRFEYGLKVGTYKAKNYLQFMDTQADKAMKRLFDTGKFTVIIQDNASIHRANSVKERIQMWSKQGLILFFLPPYVSIHP